MSEGDFQIQPINIYVDILDKTSLGLTQTS